MRPGCSLLAVVVAIVGCGAPERPAAEPASVPTPVETTGSGDVTPGTSRPAPAPVTPVASPPAPMTPVASPPAPPSAPVASAPVASAPVVARRECTGTTSDALQKGLMQRAKQ